MRLLFLARLGKTRIAESPARAVRTALDFHPGVYPHRSKPGYFGPWCVGTTTFLGRPAPRARKLERRSSESMEARAVAVVARRCELLSAHPASGGFCGMRRLTLALIAASILLAAVPAAKSQSGGELHFVLRAEPKTFDPMLVDEEASETIRFLTGGVLIRVNRKTQALEPELAASWKVSQRGKKISFHLRDGLSFSDGTPFSAEDVAFTMRKLLDPNLHSPTGDSFRSSEGSVRVAAPSARDVIIEFPAPVAGLERLFDQVAIVSSRSPKKETAVLVKEPFKAGDGSWKLDDDIASAWGSHANRAFRGPEGVAGGGMQVGIQQFPHRECDVFRAKRSSVGKGQAIAQVETDLFPTLRYFPGRCQFGFQRLRLPVDAN